MMKKIFVYIFCSFLIQHITNAKSYNDLDMQNKLDYKKIQMDCIADMSIKIYNEYNNKISLLANKRYENSVFREIPKAIAKCMKGIDEFSKVTNGVVKFLNTEINKYTRSNLNALVLYNYIYALYNTKETDICKVADKIMKHYKIDNKKINDSIHDITQCDKELCFSTYIKSIVKNRTIDKNYLKCFKINCTKTNLDTRQSFVTYYSNIILNKTIKTVWFLVEFQNDRIKNTYIKGSEQSSDNGSSHLEEFVPVKDFHANGKYNLDDFDKTKRNRYLFNFESIKDNIDGASIGTGIKYKDPQFLITYEKLIKGITIKTIKSKSELKDNDIVFAIPNVMYMGEGMPTPIEYSDTIIEGKDKWSVFQYIRQKFL